MKRILYLLLLLGCAGPSIAGVIKGKVVDSQGDPLPFATVYVQGTTMGTNANGNGEYELTLQAGTYKLLCEYVGYKQEVFNVTITGDQPVAHVFKLSSQSLEIKEVEVRASAEDPAYGIIREAIKRRQEHLDQIRTFQTGIYFKGVARSRVLPKKVMGQKVNAGEMGADSSGHGVLYLSEESADYYSEKGKSKTVIHSVHTSGNPKGLGFSQFPRVVSFYNNNLDLFGSDSRGYISPISDNALNYYKYHLEGDFVEQGQLVHKIKVMVKRPYEPCFSGTIYIIDGDYSIHSLDMLLTKEGGLDFLDSFRISQIFIPGNDNIRLIKSQVLYFTIKVFGFDVTASGVSVYNNQRANEPIPDTIFASKVISTYDRTAIKNDSGYWTTNRPVPLEGDEQKDFVVKDSIRKVEEDPKRIDSLRRKGNHFKPVAFLLGGYAWNSNQYKTAVITNPLLLGLIENNMINYNIVEGFNLAPKLHIRHMLDTGEHVQMDVAPRYGFSNTHFNLAGRLFYTKDDRSWAGRGWLAGVEGGKYVYQFNPQNPVSEWFNSYSALFYRQNDLKIYERWEAAGFARRTYGNGLTWNARVSFQHRMPLQNTSTYSFFPGDRRGFTSNILPDLLQEATAWEVHNAVLLHAAVSYQPGYVYTQLPDRKVGRSRGYPTFTLSYDKGVPGIFNSKTDYDKWRFSMHHTVGLKLAGNLEYNLVAGGFLNTNYVSIPDLMYLYGNRGIGYASPYLQSFQFAEYFEFTNKSPLYGEAHIEYHLNGLLTNKIPGLKQLQWYLLFGTNSFYSDGGAYYAEAFVGVENIGYKVLRVGRIDFVQSWDSHMGHNSGLRFGFNLGGATVSSSGSGPVHGEW